MSQKNSAQSIIQSYRKRQQMGPFIIGGLAVVLVVVGLLVLVIWLTGPNKPGLALFASQTPTPTNTATATPVTPTSTATTKPTDTVTPTITETPTPNGPTKYTVQENDNCWDIAAKFKVDLLVLLAQNNFPANSCPVNPGDEIIIPAPDAALPTATAVPTNFRGEVSYVIQIGDSIASIAYNFYSTENAIVARNKIKDKAKINAGDTIIIPVNIATHVPTKAPTSTKNPATQTAAAVSKSATPTATIASTAVPSATRLP